MQRNLSRRDFLGLGAGALAAGTLAACGQSSGGAGASGGGGGAKSPLTIVTWGGTTQDGFQKAWATPFTQKTGIPTHVTAPVDYAKYTAQIKSGKVSWDYVDIENWWAYAHRDLLANIDYKTVKVKAGDLITIGDKQPLTPWGVSSGSYSFAIGYRTDKGPHPRDWVEFFDPSKVPGKRGIYNWPYGMIEAALLGDGVTWDQMYPLDVERALKKLQSIRSSLVFWNSGAELQQMLASGSVPFAYAWNNRVAYLAQHGSPVDIEWQDNIQDSGYYTAPKHDPRYHELMEYLNFGLQPSVDTQYALMTGYSPALKASLQGIPASKRHWYNAYGPNLAKAAGLIDAEWWGKNFDAVQAKWTKWASS